MRAFASLEELAGAAGEVLGPGPWRRVEQHTIDAFAAATGDDQWIHTDPARAARSRFGTTIAHGYLVLALLPALTRQLYRVDGVAMAVNYGLDRVRFPAPARAGSSVRARAQITRAEPLPGGVHLAMRVTVETDAGGRPCCVAETLTRLYPGPEA